MIFTEIMIEELFGQVLDIEHCVQLEKQQEGGARLPNFGIKCSDDGDWGDCGVTIFHRGEDCEETDLVTVRLPEESDIDALIAGLECCKTMRRAQRRRDSKGESKE